MKKVFVPKGEIVRHNSLYTERLVVNGLLQISGKLVAKKIVGSGIIEAGEIVCDDIRASSVTSGFITAKRIAADKVFVQSECRASEAIAVRDYITAAYVSTGTLSITLSDIGSCDADEIITLHQRRSLLGLLWASWWRGLFMEMFHDRVIEDDETEQQETAPEMECTALTQEPVTPVSVQDDDTIDMIITVLTDLRKHGYRVSKIEKPDTGRGNAAA